MTEVGANDVVHELAQILFLNETRESTLAAVAKLAHKTLPSCVAASVTVADRGRARTEVSSAELALVLDEAQYETNQGPCLDAMRTRQRVAVSSFDEESRWPPFTRRVRESEVESSLSLRSWSGRRRWAR